MRRLDPRCRATSTRPSTSTAVVLWKGYDNPADVLAAAAGSIECTDDLATAAHDLTEFVASLGLEPEQSLTVIAHSFGSIVVGAALADAGLEVTDVVVAGSPGMTVDDLRQLHLEQSHFFSEQAPGDAIAELGVFGASPASPSFGGTRMSTNAPDHPPVVAHSRYFEPGSEALENMVDVVTGHYSDIVRHRAAFPEIAGGLVAWALRMPVVPLQSGGAALPGPRVPGVDQLVPPDRPRCERDGQPRQRGPRRERARPAVVRPPGRCGAASPRGRRRPGATSTRHLGRPEPA